MIRLPKISLARREKFLLAGGLSLLFLLIFFRLFAFGHKKIRLQENRNRKSEKNLEYMYTLQNRYSILEKRLESFDKTIAARPADFKIFSYLENLASQAGMEKRIVSIRPETRQVTERYRRSLVRLQLEGVSPEEMTRYLYAIENSPHFLEIRKLRIAPQYREEGLLDVHFEVFTFIPKEI
jgi:hypothetical protein